MSEKTGVPINLDHYRLPSGYHFIWTEFGKLRHIAANRGIKPLCQRRIVVWNSWEAPLPTREVCLKCLRILEATEEVERPYFEKAK